MHLPRAPFNSLHARSGPINVEGQTGASGRTCVFGMATPSFVPSDRPASTVLFKWTCVAHCEASNSRVSARLDGVRRLVALPFPLRPLPVTRFSCGRVLAKEDVRVRRLFSNSVFEHGPYSSKTKEELAYFFSATRLTLCTKPVFSFCGGSLR